MSLGARSLPSIGDGLAAAFMRSSRPMTPQQIAARTAFVLETNNLRGGSGMAAAVASLERLFARLARQTVPLRMLAQVVVVHDGLPREACEAITQLAGRSVDYVAIDTSVGYYDAKNRGFEATDPARCDHVAFADADCIPADDWLEQLIAPLACEAPPPVVAGRTSYPAGMLGTALTTIDFMYFPSPLRPQATRNFYANNVLFRREVFARHAYQAMGEAYRAHCQVLGLRLQAEGIAVHYAPAAHTVHRLPDTRRECLTLRWWRGQDTVGLTPHLVRAYLPTRLQWFARSGPVAPLVVLAVRLGASLRALNHQHLPKVSGLRWLGAAVLIAGFSLVDMAGALYRGLGFGRRHGAAADAQALSYHRG